MLGSGETATTSSGRNTTPFPKVSTGTDRKTGGTLKRVDEWLRQNAIDEAKSRGDEFNQLQFENSNPKRLSPADRDSMNEYLFGEKPTPTAQPTAPNDTQARQNVPSGQPQGTQPGNLSKQETGGETAKAGGVVQEAQVEPTDISIGPGAAAPTDVARQAQIEQLSDAFSQKAPLQQRVNALVRDSWSAGETMVKAKDALSRGLNALKTSGEAIWNTISKFENPDELLKSKGQLSAELEKRGWRTREFAKMARKAVPEKSRRAAIAKWIDAGGDASVLRNGEAAAPERYKQAYRDALNLSPEDQIHAQNIINYFESRLQEAISEGVLEHGLTDYIHRIYERKPELRDKAIAYVQSGILSKNPSLARKRFFQYDWEAEQAGLHPVQDFIPRVAEYETSLSRAIAARKFIKQLTDMDAPDGRPIISIKGSGYPVENQTTGVREATLIRPRGDFGKQMDPNDAINYRKDYVNREYMALSKWKWVGKDSGGQTIYLQGDVAIHPKYVGRVDALLEPSHVRYGRYPKLGKALQDVSSTVKQTMLDLSMFHQVQIAIHAMEHRVMPWKIIDNIDFENPKVDGLLKGGVTLGGEYRSGHYGEGLIGSSLTRKIPGLGEVMEGYHSWLFQSFIPRVKMTMALHALERNRAAYAKAIASGKLTEDGLYQMTAKQANAAFGELNYTMLERSKTTQDIARLIMLAPDFLEARAKFVGQAFTRSGQEQRVALLLGALTMWTLARIANKVLDDQYHFEPENLFSVVHNGRSWSMRTVQGDILHLIDKPVGFWLNRLNPVYTRPALQIASQRDQFGRKRTYGEIAMDTVSNVIPISLRSNRERKLWESLFNAFGGNVRRWNDVESSRKLADDWNKKHGKQPYVEVIYDSDKDPLRPLKIALSLGDEAAAAKEIKNVLDGKVKTTQELEKYFKWYASAPFTGTKATDAKWYSSLSEDQRKTVDGARLHRKNMGALYHKALGQYYAASAKAKP